MSVTKVTYVSRFERQLDRVPHFIKHKVILWIYEVESFGISQVMKRRGYHDEPLKGFRFGQRSVRMNKAYRVIYRIIEDRIHIELLEVNKHDY